MLLPSEIYCIILGSLFCVCRHVNGHTNQFVLPFIFKREEEMNVACKSSLGELNIVSLLSVLLRS